MLKKALIILSTFVFVSCSQNEVQEKVTAGQGIVIDVRSAEEFNAGHLEDAVNIPHTEIGSRIVDYVKDKDTEISLYCRSGRRSGLAQTKLLEMGYRNAVNAGGYEELKAREGKQLPGISSP